MTTANADFQTMLNEYLPNEMFFEETIKRDWFLSNVEKDDSWKGSKVIVPFMGARASSVEFGQLAGASDISQSKPVRGEISGYKEVWGSLIFNHRDLLDHEGKMKEASFLRILPDEVEAFQTTMKEVVSQQLMNGLNFDTFTADGTAGGVIALNHPERFSIGQKIEIDDGNSAALSVYVIAIDMNANTITVSATRGGAAADVSAYTTAQSAKVYYPGVLTNGSFVSLREAILSLANGGSATIHGQTKLSYPALQAIQINGTTPTAITATNILGFIFDAYTTVRRKAKGNANKVVLSYKHLGSIFKILEDSKGAYNVTKQPKTSVYGWTEITVTTVKGELDIVGVQEMEDDVIFLLDMKAMKFRTRGGFRKRMSPDGKEYFEVRATTGFQYIVDACLFGEMEYRGIGQCAVIHTVANY
jgi:hypothetical protein